MRSNTLAASPAPQGNLPCCPAHVQPAAHATPIGHPRLRPWPQHVSAGGALFHLSASGITAAIRQLIHCHVISVHISSICVLVLLPGQTNCGKVHVISVSILWSCPSCGYNFRPTEDLQGHDSRAKGSPMGGSRWVCLCLRASQTTIPMTRWHQAAPRQLPGQLHQPPTCHPSHLGLAQHGQREFSHRIGASQQARHKRHPVPPLLRLLWIRRQALPGHVRHGVPARVRVGNRGGTFFAGASH